MKPKPTIAELEAILNEPNPNTRVTIRPDGSITATDGHERTIAWPDPEPGATDDPKFTAIWDCIKSWDINVPAAYSGYMGATGNHVRAIMDAIEAAGFYIASPERLERAEWVLEHSGFRRCNTMACNCGSWHQVGGFKLRFDEIKEAVEDAGYSTGGRTLLDAVKEMAGERERCVTLALEQRCERGTPWDRACVTIAEVIRASRPLTTGERPK